MFFRYHRLLTLKYGSKTDKALATKGWAKREGLSVQETQRAMDVELFLEGQERWEADSPHHLMMLHKMLQHTLQQGQREVEHMVCHGCRQGLPKLDPEVDVSAVQLVGPHTSRKEIESLYHEVFKLWRLPGSPPGEPELVAEVVSLLEVCQKWEESEMPQMAREPWSTGI